MKKRQFYPFLGLTRGGFTLRLNDTHGYLLRRWRGYNELEVYCILNNDCQNYAVAKQPLQRFKSLKYTDLDINVPNYIIVSKIKGS